VLSGAHRRINPRRILMTDYTPRLVDVADLDQHHAEALDLLRGSCEHFFLWALSDDAPRVIIACCADDSSAMLESGAMLESVVGFATKALETLPSPDDLGPEEHR
jgi:hypothetical protein